jgi:hypothetical protein
MRTRLTAFAALAAFAFTLGSALAPRVASATPAVIEIPVTVKVTVRVPGAYFFRFDLVDLDDNGAVVWSEWMDPAGKKRALATNKLTHTLGSLWAAAGTPALDPALFQDQLWLRVSAYRNGAWVRCSADLRLNVVPYAVWSALSAAAADDVITTYMIQDGAVTGGKLADGAVSAEKLADGAVTGGKIADGSVTFDKLGGSCDPSAPQLVYGPQGWDCGTSLTCRPGDFLYCYHAPFPTLNVGPCRPGVRACTPQGTGFDAACVGEVLPQDEACNDLDDDCDGIVDNPGDGPLLYRDVDADGFGDSLVSRKFCSAEQPGWAGAGNDCDDKDAVVYPGAKEACDCKDNDCDSLVDDGCTLPGVCTGQQFSDIVTCVVEFCGGEDPQCFGCFSESGECGVAAQSLVFCLALHNFPCAMDDFACMSEHGCADEVATMLERPGCGCNETRPCGDTPAGVGVCKQGVTTCNAGEWTGACVGAVYPGYEVCANQKDDDCDGATDEPGGIEVCDGQDNDCDGNADNVTGGVVHCVVPPGPSCAPAQQEEFDACVSGCGQDLRCLSDCGSALACARDVERMELLNCSQSACLIENPDGPPLFNPDCFTLPELCKPVYDAIFVGVQGECLHGESRACGPATEVGVCVRGTETCDGGVWSGCAGAVWGEPEVCGNGLDDDCDGDVDEDTDLDQDGFGTCSGGDCDDGNPMTYPGAQEICDNADNDCDGEIDGPAAYAACPEDADACTARVCVDGQCLQVPPACDDWDGCTIDSCNPATGECTFEFSADLCPVCGDGVCAGSEPWECPQDCVPPDPCAGVNCDDGVSCTDDVCDSGNGQCAHNPVDAACDNGSVCDGVETCDSQLGCQPGVQLLCDDGNACNGGETCDPVWGCQGGAPPQCDDGNLCNGTETCDPALGCQGGAPVQCDDGIACTDDLCVGQTGACEFVPVDARCDDGDACTFDWCNPAAGCAFEPDFVCACGNGVCDGFETQASCPQDCPGVCGDGFVDLIEGCDDANAAPGDGCSAACAIESGYACSGLPSVCAAVCGDAICLSVENRGNCPADCPSTCGNDACEAWESAASCPDDCPATCGDGFCTGAENPGTCAADCPAYCGDGLCNGGETPLTCTDCPAVCGDGLCNEGEPESCAGDCTCGNGVCDGSDTPASCPGDCHPVINEIDYDQPGTDTAEFLELYNPTGAAIALQGYRVDLVNGADGGIYATIALPAVSLAAGDYFVIGKSATVANVDLEYPGVMQNGNPDGVRIVWVASGQQVDGLAYGLAGQQLPGAGEGAIGPVDGGVGSVSRCPNGVDTGSNANDFALATATPGAANLCP